MCNAEGHNSVTPVRLKPVAHWPPVKHSTTEPLRSLNMANNDFIYYHTLFFGNQKHTFDINQCVHDSCGPAVILVNFSGTYQRKSS